MIDRTIKNIKEILEYFGGNTYSKNISKKILYKVLEGILTAKIANKKKKINSSTTVDLYILCKKGQQYYC